MMLVLLTSAVGCHRQPCLGGGRPDSETHQAAISKDQIVIRQDVHRSDIVEGTRERRTGRKILSSPDDEGELWAMHCKAHPLLKSRSM